MTMTQTDPLHSVKLKIERAKHHFSDLKAELVAYGSRNPYSVIREHKPKAREYVYRFKIREPIPHNVTLIIGDVVHTLRTSLDHLICQCVKANGAQVIRRTHFPIAGGERQFIDDLDGAVKGASKQTKNLVRRLKPYKGGKEPFWVLNRLDIMDKHNEIIPVWSAFRQTNVIPNLPSEWFKHGPIEMPMLTLTTKMSGKPVEDGTKFFSISGDIEEAEKYSKLQFGFNIAFGKAGALDGEPVIPSLAQLIQFTERVVDIFGRHIFK